MKLFDALRLVRDEVLRAQEAHRPMHSEHEAYAVIKEELDELWEDVKSEGRVGNSKKEAIQTAAMAVRMLVDLF